MTELLTLSTVGKSFDEVEVLRDVTLSIEEGEILVLLGPSGSGKTTLLRAIAGFERPDSGAIELAGEDITGLPPAKRSFGMVFQHYALFPHLTVGENVGFGLDARDVEEVKKIDRIRSVLDLVDLAGYERRRIHEISGGQQQRVALARALAPEPRVLLLDEPLSNLDPTLRVKTRRQLRRTLNTIGITAVWVTHEQEEAFDVGDRVAVLNDGRLEQVGTSEELYEEPVSRFVAGFVGRASWLPAKMTGGREVILGDDRFVGCSARWPAIGDESPEIGDDVDLMVRPDGLRLTERDVEGSLAAGVLERSYAGEVTYYRVEIEKVGEALVLGSSRAARTGDQVGVTWRFAGPRPRIFARAEEAEEETD